MSQHTAVNYNIQINTLETEDFIKCNQDQCKPKKNLTRRCLFPDQYPSFFARTKEVLSKGLRKLNKSFSDLKNAVGRSNQNVWFHNITRSEIEKYDLVSSAFQTPSRVSRSMLGRTPIKLYSPFGIETPVNFQ